MHTDFVLISFIEPDVRKTLIDLSLKFPKKSKFEIFVFLWQVEDSNSLPMFNHHKTFREYVKSHFAQSPKVLSKALNNFRVIKIK